MELGASPFHVNPAGRQTKDPPASLRPRLEAPLESKGHHLDLGLRGIRVAGVGLSTEQLAVLNTLVEIPEQRPSISKRPRPCDARRITEASTVVVHDVAIHPANAELDADLSTALRTFGGGSTGRDHDYEKGRDQATQMCFSSQQQSFWGSSIVRRNHFGTRSAQIVYVRYEYCNPSPQDANYSVKKLQIGPEMLACEYFHSYLFLG
jgi:hypothetical protein